MDKIILAQASLTLYTYYLRTDISKGAEGISKDADQIWERLVELGHTLQIPVLQSLKDELICYNPDGTYEPKAENKLTNQRGNLLRSPDKHPEFDLTVSITGKDLTLSGELTPFRLHDTYAIDLTLSSQGTIFVDELRLFNPKELLLPNFIPASIGQTLVLYAKFAMPVQDDYNLEDLADDCVTQLLGNRIQYQWDRNKGKLLNNLIFEYETLEIEPSKRCHILIWFINKDTPPTNEKLMDVSSNLLTLLCARHKILSAYNEYQNYNYKAENLYSELQEEVKNFDNIISYLLETRLEKFKVLLAKLPIKIIDYSQCLMYGADYENTIKTNLKNYELSFEELNKLPDCDLSFLKEFMELTHQKYEAQIQTDRQYFQTGGKFFQQLLDIVQGMVAIDQVELAAQKAKRDIDHKDKAQKQEKRLELLITGVGTGLAASSISAAVMPKPSEILLPPSFKDSIGGFSFLIDVGLHLLGGFVFGIFISLTFWKIRSSSSN